MIEVHRADVLKSLAESPSFTRRTREPLEAERSRWRSCR